MKTVPKHSEKRVLQVEDQQEVQPSSSAPSSSSSTTQGEEKNAEEMKQMLSELLAEQKSFNFKLLDLYNLQAKELRYQLLQHTLRNEISVLYLGLSRFASSLDQNSKARLAEELLQNDARWKMKKTEDGSTVEEDQEKQKVKEQQVINVVAGAEHGKMQNNNNDNNRSKKKRTANAEWMMEANSLRGPPSSGTRLAAKRRRASTEAVHTIIHLD